MNVVWMYVWWKEKKTVFLQKEKKNDFFLRIYVQKDWLRDHTSWALCGIEMKIKGILKSWFWISLHQGTLSILYSRIQGYMLFFMNEVDPCLLLPLCILYKIQNQIFSNMLILYFCLPLICVPNPKKSQNIIFSPLGRENI